MLVLPNLSPNALILALDVGSSSVRAMIFGREGNALDAVFAQQHYPAQTTPDGGSTVDPDMLCDLIFASIAQVVEQAGAQAKRIAAAVMDTLGTTLVGVGAGGHPTTPLYTAPVTRRSPLAERSPDRLRRLG